MGFFLFNQDISQFVQRETVSYRQTLNISGENGSGGHGQATFDLQLIVDTNQAVYPRTGNLITWYRDDSTGIKQFAGPIINMKFHNDGFNETGKNVYRYELQCRDLSYFLEKQIVRPGRYDQDINATRQVVTGQRIKGDPQTNFTEISVKEVNNFPSYFGNSYKGFMETMAQVGDIRITLDPKNDDADNLINKDFDVSRMTYGQLLDQLSTESGLVWWIDADFVFHLRKIDTLLKLPIDPRFTISESSLNYYNLDLTEDFNNLVSRVTVMGNFHDGGWLNDTNRTDGIQRTEEVSSLVTNRPAVDEVMQRTFPQLAKNKGPAQLGGAGRTLFYPTRAVNNTVISDLGPYSENAVPPNTLVPQRVGFPPEVILNGQPGITSAIIYAPSAYFEKPDEAQSFLAEVGKQYLYYHSRPSLFAEVYYNIGDCPQIGAPVRIKLDQLGIDQISAVAGLEISSGGEHQGNTESGTREYVYKVSLQDYGYHLRFGRQFYLQQQIKLRKPRNLKPLPPIVNSIFFSKNGGMPIISLALQMQNRNSEQDRYGNPQPTLPPIDIGHVEFRCTPNTLALSNPNRPDIFWSSWIDKPVPDNVHLTNLLAPYNSVSNEYVGEVHHWRIVFAPDYPTLYYQVRSVSNNDIVSNWSSVNTITLGDKKDGNGNDTPDVPGDDHGVDGLTPDPTCCPMVPIPSPPGPPPCTPGDVGDSGMAALLATINSQSISFTSYLSFSADVSSGPKLTCYDSFTKFTCSGGSITDLHNNQVNALNTAVVAYMNGKTYSNGGQTCTVTATDGGVSSTGTAIAALSPTPTLDTTDPCAPPTPTFGSIIGVLDPDTCGQYAFIVAYTQTTTIGAVLAAAAISYNVNYSIECC